MPKIDRPEIADGSFLVASDLQNLSAEVGKVNYILWP